MKTKVMITMLVSVAMILTTPLVTLGAPGGTPGRPGGGGGGAGDAPAAGALYGDLYVIERDGKGVPTTREVTYEDSETGQDVTVDCPQPLAEDCSRLKLWGEDNDFNPEEDDPCAVYNDGEYPTPADQLQTVSFGRESVSRSPATVIDKSYAEALKAINLAVPECDSQAIKLDPAGRIMLCLLDEDGEGYWKTIDAPLENLGLYREVMTDGCFGPIDEVEVGEEGVPITVTTELSPEAKGYLTATPIPSLGHLVCPGGTVTKDDMLSAAVFIAAGADKTSPINLDEIINVNTYLKVNTWTYERVKKETILTVTYFEFADSGGPEGWFAYKRGVGGDACVPGTEATLLTGTSPTYTVSTVDVFGGTPDGVDLRGGNGVPITVCREGFPLGDVCDDPVTNPVYGSDDDGILGCGGANWFAQAAEDARKTIWYLHNWRVPEDAY